MNKHLTLLLFIGLAFGQTDTDDYIVPDGSRFNVSSLIKMNVEDIEKLLGEPLNRFEPTEYQKATGMKISSNIMWRIKEYG